MPVAKDELTTYPKLVQIVEAGSQFLEKKPGGYFRLRLRPRGKDPYTIASKIQEPNQEALMREIVGRIIRANSTCNVLVEVMEPGGNERYDYTEIPPLLEAWNEALGAQVQIAESQGASAVTVALIEMLGRLFHAMMNERNNFYARWMDSEDKRADVKFQLLEAQLMDMLSSEDFSNGDGDKWTVIGEALKSTLGPPGEKAAALIDLYLKNQQTKQIPQQNGQGAAQAPTLPAPPPQAPAAAKPASQSAPQFTPEPLHDPDSHSEAPGRTAPEPEPEVIIEETTEGKIEAGLGALLELLEDADAVKTLMTGETPYLDLLKPHVGTLKLAMGMVEEKK